MNNNLLLNKKGLSLVELMIVLALLSVVLSAAYSFLFFGQNSYNRGERQSNLQRDLRLTADFITRDTRYATELTLIETVPVANDSYNYIWIQNNRVMHRNSSGVTRSLTDPVILGAGPFFLIKNINNRNLLEFSLQGNNDEQNYTLNSDLFLYNLPSVLPAGTNHVIKYKKS